MNESTCHTESAHCESCGRTDHGAGAETDGYSACCNELVVSSSSCRGHHVADEEFQRALDDEVTAAGFASREEFIAADPARWERVCDRLERVVYGV